jgi:transcriptional regulator of acetoin/glycerol metabolism
LLAVLDASTVDARDTRTSQTHTMALVNLSARLIEKCVFLRHHQNAVIVRFHARPELVNLLHDGSLALGPGGNVIAADETAVRLLGARGRGDLVGHTLEEIFDTSVRDLLSPASSARQALWPVRDLAMGRRYFASVHFSGGASGNAGAAAAARADSGGASSSRGSLGDARAIDRGLQVRGPSSTSRMPAVSGPAAPSVRPAIRVPPEHRNLTLADIAGDDPQLMRTVRRAARVTSSGLPILIQGPTGTGKECLARALHDAGERASRPFVAVNCAAFPETLIESELFGYGPGAFTGARKEGRKGRILQSSGGTLFLDEIGDMPLTLQTRLLRVLEEQEVTPLGSEQVLSVDLRIMCASHRRLRDMVAQGTFREDLYYRLNGMTFELPALAERADKHALIRRLLAREANGAGKSIDTAALQKLSAYGWPGNIRELSNAIRGALAICEGGIIRASDLPPEIEGTDSTDAERDSASSPGGGGFAPAPANGLRRAERDAVLDAIKANDGNMAGAARTLGISRNTLYRKLRSHGIVVSRIEGLSLRRTGA